ncbi:MAG: hypothetical protein ACRDJE_16200 [Dehalococcoidia bacterium]
MMTPPAFDHDFDWDGFNVEHIKIGHNVSPTEAKDAILDPNRVPAKARSTRPSGDAASLS